MSFFRTHRAQVLRTPCLSDNCNTIVFNRLGFVDSRIKLTVPGAPTGVSGTRGDGQVAVSWTAPVANGGSAITLYTVKSSPGNFTATTSSGTSATVTGLTNGTAYTFTVIATNLVGSSLVSSASSAVTPDKIPGAPTSVSGTRGNGQVAVSWTAPVANGGSAITLYTVTSSPGNITATTSSGTSATVTGLTNGTAYTFTVVATNGAGNSSASTASSSVTPYTVSGAPTGVSGTRGNGQVAVSWSAPSSDGGNAITLYTVTSSPGNITATSSGTSATVTGLTNGTAYTFTVTATNDAGNSSASTASSSVTPYTVPGAPEITTLVPDIGQVTVSWSAPASDGGNAITSYTVTSNPGSITATTTGTSIAVTGLTDGIEYTFTVVATNGDGSSVASSESSITTPGRIAGSLVFNGTNQYLSLNPGVAIGGGAYTLEGWLYNTGSSWVNSTSSVLGGDNNLCLSVFFNNATSLSTDLLSMGLQGTYNFPAVSLNAWHHFALVRDSSQIETLFIDGARATSCAGGTNIVSGYQTNIVEYNGNSNWVGQHWEGYWKGYFTNYRIVVGTALYDVTTSSITVPTLPLTFVANTQYLMLGDSVTTDTAGIQTVTNNGTVTQNSSKKPF